jgi:hypothetical protein
MKWDGGNKICFGKEILKVATYEMKPEVKEILNLWKISCEDVKWTEMGQDIVQW